MIRNLLLESLLHTRKTLEWLAEGKSPAVSRVIRGSVFVVLLPPIFSWLGASNFGWRLGGSEPIFVDAYGEFLLSVLYFVILTIGFVGTVFISRWMAPTYGASTDLSLHFAFFTIICEPLVVASAAHLFPDIIFNVLILLPAFLYSISLLYNGLPVIFNIPPERGMLMASALVGWLLVAAVSLLGLSVSLWMKGIGSVFGL